jgi:hypothetical protein
MRGFTLRLVVASVVAWMTVGAAAADVDPVADALFQEAKRLEATDVPAACAKYRASYDRDPAVTTGLRLADCYRRAGRLATSLAWFQQIKRTVEQTATGANLTADARAAVLATIEKNRAEIAPQVSHLRISVATPSTDVVVRRTGPDTDGEVAVSPDTWACRCRSMAATTS